jgi:hypothetical protein
LNNYNCNSTNELIAISFETLCKILKHYSNIAKTKVML